MKFVLSSGHGKYVRGASGLIDEVDEARKVVPEVAAHLRDMGHEVVEFHDDTSTTQDQNLKTIVNFHNSQDRDLDVSVHFNAYIPTDGGYGTEVLYATQENIATRVAEAIASYGLINRGAKHRSDLYFLNKTEEPSILIEVCFVDAAADVEAYQQNFKEICAAIAHVAPDHGKVKKDRPLYAKGKVSWFGGPDDMGVTPSEGLAFIYEYNQAPHLFLDEQPPNTTGLARRLDPEVPYIAMRWDYEVHSKEYLRSGKYLALVRAPKTGKQVAGVYPSDWGPHADTARVADISEGLMKELGITTDDMVEVVFPHKTTKAKHK
jgi:N-acetylmuramoyl-L-alanine amidase